MGICSAKKPQQSQPILPQHPVKITKPEPTEQKIDEPQGEKLAQQSNRRSSQNSLNSQKSLYNPQNPQEARKSVLSQGIQVSKSKERPSKSKHQRADSQRSINTPQSPQSARRSLQQGVQFFSTNASKKYSLLYNKDQQLNVLFPKTQTELTFMENNKTGSKVRLELLSKKEEQSIKYIYWLKSNQLDHKNILKNLEVHQDNDWYQVINDYFDGQKLTRLMNSDALSEKVLADIADQMLSVLSFMKNQSLIHGNLSLNSWEYKFNGKQITIKLIDVKPFSVKQPEEQETIIYTPPDLIYNPQFTQERDIWAVMICLFILGKGSMPYQISSKQQGDLAAIKQIVLHQQFNLEKEVTKFSKEFIEFLHSIIGSKQKKNRINLEQLRNNKWLNDNKSQELPVQTRLLLNMLNQKETCLLHQVIMEIMVQEYEQETAMQLQKMFIEFDTDLDMMLQQDELIKMFKKYTNEANLEEKIPQLFTSNQIKKPEIQQYTFLSLAAPRDDLLTKTRLETIFQVLSNNKSEITSKNITKYLNITNEELEAQFDELIPDKRLTLDQFIRIMELAK